MTAPVLTIGGGLRFPRKEGVPCGFLKSDGLDEPRKPFPSCLILDFHFKLNKMYLLFCLSCPFDLSCHKPRKDSLSDNKLFILLINIIGC